MSPKNKETRVIIVKEGGGPSYTRAGENETIIQQKAFAFKETWESYKNNKNINALVRPATITEDLAWQSVIDIYKNSDKISWAMKIEASGFDLLFCKEDDVRQTLFSLLFSESSTITKKSYINRICSMLRTFWTAIGRENSYGSGKQYLNLGVPLLHSGNPMTTATEDYLVKELVDQGGRYDSEKHGAPVSIVLAYIIIMHFLSTLLTTVHKWADKSVKQVERIVNLAMLIMLYAFLLHDAGRPIESVLHLHHENLYFPLHEKVYWLTLALVKPETLEYLLSKNLLSYYVIGSWKGKLAQHRVHRLKAAIPTPYNSIDLFTIFVICMRCVIAVDPTQLKSTIFKSQNYTSLRSRRSKHLNIKDMTFYSFRYAAAEEDVNYKIKEAWTRIRMGHEPNSNTKNRYASKNERVNLQDTQIPLGVDVVNQPTNPKLIQLEMVTIDETGCTYQSDWLKHLDDAPLSIRQDFLATHERVKNFIDDPSNSPVTTNTTDPVFDIEGFKKIPLGFNLAFNPKMVTKEMTSLFTTAKDTLTTYFKTPEAPNIIPELWSFPQIQYGNWRHLLSIPYQTFPVAPSNIIQKDKPGPSGVTNTPTNISDNASNDSAPEDQPGPSNVNTIPQNRSEDGSEDEDYDGELDLSKIEPGNFIVVKCDNPSDGDRLRLLIDPSIFVWVCKVHSIRPNKTLPNTYNIEVTYYINREKDITKPLKKKKTTKKVKDKMQISQWSVMDIYTTEDDNIDIDENNIKDLVDFIKRHPTSSN